MLPRDERRFKTADLDGDLAATREEFTAFLHPEEFEHMKNIVVLVSKAKSENAIVRGLECPEGKCEVRLQTLPLFQAGTR